MRTHIQKQNTVSRLGSELIHYTLSYFVCPQCIQSKGQSNNHRECINIYAYSIGYIYTPLHLAFIKDSAFVVTWTKRVMKLCK